MLVRLQPSFIRVLCLLAMLLMTFPKVLQAEDGAPWNVVVASNATVAHSGGAAEPLAKGTEVAAGDRITTGAGGAVVLGRGEDLITMAENSQVAIVDPQPGSATLLEQPYGQAQYHVTKQPNPHFEVDTPLLATIVKGTTFDVSATAAGSAVAVEEGRVQARDRRGGGSGLVGKGEIGRVMVGLPGVEISLGTLQKAASLQLETPAAMIGSAELETAPSGLDSDSSGLGAASPGGAVGAVGNALGNAVGNVGGTVSSVGNAVGNTVSNVGNAVGNTVSNVGNALSNTTSAATNAVGKTVTGAGTAVSNLTGGPGASSGGAGTGGSSAGSAGGSSAGGASAGGSSAGGSSAGGASAGGGSTGNSSAGGSSTGGSGTGGDSLGDRVGGAVKDVADHLGGLLH